MSVAATPLAPASGSVGPVYKKLVVEPFDFTVPRTGGVLTGQNSDLRRIT